MGLTGSKSSTNDTHSSRVLTFHYVSFSTSVCAKCAQGRSGFDNFPGVTTPCGRGRFLPGWSGLLPARPARDIMTPCINPSKAVIPNGYTSKSSGPCWSNPTFLIFLTFGHSGA